MQLRKCIYTVGKGPKGCEEKGEEASFQKHAFHFLIEQFSSRTGSFFEDYLRFQITRKPSKKQSRQSKREISSRPEVSSKEK